MAAIPLDCDVLVIGGGINGAGIARDVAGRGWSTVLCEKDDLAGHTSSASTKLIHGGLRYLEQGDFRLVRKALAEREVLLRSAPHLIRPLEFILPHDAGQRPAWLIRTGLYLYDHLARRRLLGRSRHLDLRTHAAGTALQPRLRQGFSYADGWADDARLVVLNAIDAAERGATILTRTACHALHRAEGHWQVGLAERNGRQHVLRARAVVDATGPWAGHLARRASLQQAPAPLRLVKGSHIVLRQHFTHEAAYLFQQPDGRVVFAIPFERDFTLIGTTDVDFEGDPDRVLIDAAETEYLCAAVNRYFQQPVAPQDVVWSYAGVRPLLPEGTDAARVSRDYRLSYDGEGAPLLTVVGGKLTTYRRLAEEAADRIGTALGRTGQHWTANACLPGGDLYGSLPSDQAVCERDAWITALAGRHPWLPQPLLQRYAEAYGTRIMQLLGSASRLADLGAEILPGLYAAEVTYLVEREWACCAEDILWRRTKCGLHLPAEAAAQLAAWLAIIYPDL